VRDGHGVGVNVEHHQAIAVALESGVDVETAVDDWIEHDLVGTYLTEAERQVSGQPGLARLVCASTGMEWIDAGYANQLGDCPSQLVTIDYLAAISHRPNLAVKPFFGGV